MAARLSAFFAPKILRALNAIPVYRNGAQSMVTLRESVRALLGGDSILLFPDVNYTSENGEIGELYRGFLLLERMYWRQNGQASALCTHCCEAAAGALPLEGRCYLAMAILRSR